MQPSNAMKNSKRGKAKKNARMVMKLFGKPKQKKKTELKSKCELIPPEEEPKQESSARAHKKRRGRPGKRVKTSRTASEGGHVATGEAKRRRIGPMKQQQSKDGAASGSPVSRVVGTEDCVLTGSASAPSVIGGKLARGVGRPVLSRESSIDAARSVGRSPAKRMTSEEAERTLARSPAPTVPPTEDNILPYSEPYMDPARRRQILAIGLIPRSEHPPLPEMPVFFGGVQERG